MRLYNRILSADEVKLLADTPAGQNISSAELRVEGGMAVEENLSVAGGIHLGDYKATVNSCVSEPGSCATRMAILKAMMVMNGNPDWHQ